MTLFSSAAGNEYIFEWTTLIKFINSSDISNFLVQILNNMVAPQAFFKSLTEFHDVILSILITPPRFIGAASEIFEIAEIRFTKIYKFW